MNKSLYIYISNNFTNSSSIKNILIATVSYISNNHKILVGVKMEPSKLDKSAKSDKEQQTLDKFSLKEKVKEITSNLLSKLPIKREK